MLKKNNIITGLLIGLIFPEITWLAFGIILKNKVVISGKPAIPYLLAILINLFIIKYLFKKGDDQIGQGCIISTFIAMLAALLIQIGYLR